MDPNGSGKSTLAKVLAGHPDYHVTGGAVTMDSENVLELSIEPDERAAPEAFLAFQYPSEIPGVTDCEFSARGYPQARLPEGEELQQPITYEALRKDGVARHGSVVTSPSVQRRIFSGEETLARFYRWTLVESR